jgi:hypothetical protein
MVQFDTFQKFGKDGVDAAMTSLGAFSRGLQSVAVETADYAKRSFEQSSQVVEKLATARTVETAFQIQGDYVRSAYESFVSQATKMGELTAATVKEAYAPVEGLVAKARTV